MEYIFFAIHHQGVASVVAALKAHHAVGVLGEQINDFSLALVTPLGAYHNHVSHELFSLVAG